MYYLLLSQSNWAKKILTADTAAGNAVYTVRSSRFLLECGIEVILSLKKQCPSKFMQVWQAGR